MSDIASPGSTDMMGHRGKVVVSQSNPHAFQESILKRTKLFSILVFFIGAVASAGFMYIGISNARSNEKEQFERRALELVHEIESSWHDYETAGLWIHEACHSRNVTREEFRALYEYLSTDGLQFQAAEWIPRVLREERAIYEEASRKYYEENYPEVLPYLGFRGLEPDPANPGTSILQPRSDQPFYYPVHYVEPVLPNAAAIDFDLYSSASRRATIEAAISTYRPTLTRRLRLVQETDPSAYSVLLMHPGIALERDQGPNDVVGTDLSLMVIRIPSLLERSVQDLTNDHLAVYIFDRSETTIRDEAQFLGAIEVEARKEGDVHLAAIAEIEYSDFYNANTGNKHLLYEEILEIGASRWVVSVVPLTSKFEAEVALVIVGGAVLLVATICLSLWMIHNARRSIHLQRIVEKAEAENRIVSSLFPSTVRDRLIEDAAVYTKQYNRNREKATNISASALTSEGVFGSKPIADLFPSVSIAFMDMTNFTAWSSLRDPTQVFTLLETIYNAFDYIAEELKVFKVETVGDCYVACSGLPEPRKDHAVAMAHFATRCLKEMSRITSQLGPVLGPDTDTIQIRIGLHSGQVTAGVLRGLKGRFQLFGDSMNTASRMESTGIPGKIHVSQEFAAELQMHGKSEWLTSRSDPVHVKGKGELVTFFVDTECQKKTSIEAAPSKNLFKKNSTDEKNLYRLVNWNVQIMTGYLQKIVAHRKALNKQPSRYSIVLDKDDDSIPLEEVKDVLNIPGPSKQQAYVDPESVTIDPIVLEELENLTMVIAQAYRPHGFHNFEHASHVTMSVVKLLKRIVDTEDTSVQEGFDRTFGIKSDPLTQFACVFSALIHDADHPGVPNTTLVSENAVMARAFKNKSIAEQNSVQLAWYLFVSDDFVNLRQCICCDREEFLRFRQLLVNIVMATDVMDKDLNAIRRERWDYTFSDKSLISKDEAIRHKLTIVLEHCMQASDVAHTMQHWHIYAKWNQRLFDEMYTAYKTGRIATDPSTSWYNGEIGFFDFYVIPLAKKLDACGVFGVSGHEYLNYAEQNRREWEQKGQEIVAKYIQEYQSKNA